MFNILRQSGDPDMNKQLWPPLATQHHHNNAASSDWRNNGTTRTHPTALHTCSLHTTVPPQSLPYLLVLSELAPSLTVAALRRCRHRSWWWTPRCSTKGGSLAVCHLFPVKWTYFKAFLNGDSLSMAFIFAGRSFHIAGTRNCEAMFPNIEPCSWNHHTPGISGATHDSTVFSNLPGLIWQFPSHDFKASQQSSCESRPRLVHVSS